MKEMTIPTRIYLFSIYFIGATLLTWNLINWQVKEPVMLAALCILASLALIIKEQGATNRSHYTFSFIIYGFTFAHLGVPQAGIVIIASNLVEFLVNRPRWFIQVFNTACYIFVINVAGYIFGSINPSLSLATPIGILAITLSMTAFTLLNHLIVGIIVWMARGENFRQSGIFEPLTLVIDLTLLSLGAMLVLIWNNSPFAVLLFALPIYLIYSTMRVPSLERQSETDSKTGLFNHAYFMQHLNHELQRANRFDRPLTVIMADLDLLRNINNTYGHLAGDEVLIGVAKILQQGVREYDAVARFGGEEFAILMPEITLAQGYERAEAIRQAIENTDFTIPTSVTPIKATLSLGVATREQFNQSGQDIIHNADTALYHSKLKGRNRAYAYTQDAYIDFGASQQESNEQHKDQLDGESDTKGSEKSAYQAAHAKREDPPNKNPSPPITLTVNEHEMPKPLPASNHSTSRVYLYIGGLFILSLLSFASLYWFAPNLFVDLTIQSWLGLCGAAILVLLTELYSIDLYTKRMSLSTSAAPILAGTLLFGPLGSLVLSLTYAVTAAIKNRSPLNRIVFNFSNQLLAGMLYTTFIYLTGRQFTDSSILTQVVLAVISAIIVYALNTSLISIGVHLDTRRPAYLIWKENYSWLFTIYIGMGIVASAFVFGYQHDPFIGSLLVIIPLLLVRVSQIQYVDRTRDMVIELREKNASLQKYSDEINNLNNGLLDTLAEVIDLRDPYVLGHSRGVTTYATKIAKRLGLHEKQVELVRRGGLLHDIGKLGISQDILAKPAPLTEEEFEIIKSHPKLGASLLEKSPHLRPLIPIVRHHHEFFNGKGYPDKISGNQIAIEARIVSVADAIEAMVTDRPYRKAQPKEYILAELQRCSGTQFDPLVIDAAIKILKEEESEKITINAVEYEKVQLHKPISDMRFVR